MAPGEFVISYIDVNGRMNAYSYVGTTNSMNGNFLTSRVTTNGMGMTTTVSGIDDPGAIVDSAVTGAVQGAIGGAVLGGGNPVDIIGGGILGGLFGAWNGLTDETEEITQDDVTTVPDHNPSTNYVGPDPFMDDLSISSEDTSSSDSNSCGVTDAGDTSGGEDEAPANGPDDGLRG